MPLPLEQSETQGRRTHGDQQEPSCCVEPVLIVNWLLIIAALLWLGPCGFFRSEPSFYHWFFDLNPWAGITVGTASGTCCVIAAWTAFSPRGLYVRAALGAWLTFSLTCVFFASWAVHTPGLNPHASYYMGELYDIAPAVWRIPFAVLCGAATLGALRLWWGWSLCSDREMTGAPAISRTRRLLTVVGLGTVALLATVVLQSVQDWESLAIGITVGVILSLFFSGLLAPCLWALFRSKRSLWISVTVSVHSSVMLGLLVAFVFLVYRPTYYINDLPIIDYRVHFGAITLTFLSYVISLFLPLFVARRLGCEFIVVSERRSATVSR